MLNNLKYFFKHSFIYSFASFAAKASGIILLPLYTTYLLLGDFGELAVVDATIVVLVELVNLGMSQSLVMMNNSDEYSERKKTVFFTILSATFLFCIIFLAAGELLLPFISNWFAEPSKFYVYLRLSLYIITARIINNIFLNKLRADERSVSYTIFNVLKFILIVIFVIYFVGFLKLKVVGILYSYLFSELVIILILFPMLLKHMEFKFDRKIMYSAVVFGIPLIFSSVAMMVLNVSDRYFIKYFTGAEMAGLYDLGYRVAGVLNMFFIMPLTLTLMPQAYKMFNKEGDKRYFSKIMTYLTFILVWAGLALSIFSKEIIKIFALNPSYWPAYNIVPLIVLSYVLVGMRIVASFGMYLTKNTKYIAFTAIAAALINIILNFLFIPKFGMIAAAYTTLVSFLFLLISNFYFSNRFYHIPFENYKLLKLFFVGIAFYLIIIFINENTLILRITVKILLLVLFPYVLFIWNFYEKIELERIRGFYNKWKLPSKWKENIQSEIIKLKNRD